MASWQEFSQQAPEPAKQVRVRFEAAENHVLATLRRDGSPRVSGSEVDFAGLHIMVGAMLDARKARDLQRDGRFASTPSPAAVVTSRSQASRSKSPIRGEIKAVQGNAQPCHLCRLNLAEAALTEVEGNTLVITTWYPGQSVVRFERPDNGPVVRIER